MKSITNHNIEIIIKIFCVNFLQIILLYLPVLTYIFPHLTADIFTFAFDSLLIHSENPPHSGFHIPFQTAGAVKVIPGAGGSVHQFHTEGISDTDAALKGNDSGKRILRLLSPFVAVNGKSHIAGLICRIIVRKMTRSPS